MPTTQELRILRALKDQLQYDLTFEEALRFIQNFIEDDEKIEAENHWRGGFASRAGKALMPAIRRGINAHATQRARELASKGNLTDAELEEIGFYGEPRRGRRDGQLPR